MERLVYLFICMYIYIYIIKIVTIKVSDVDKYSQSQFISSCLDGVAAGNIFADNLRGLRHGVFFGGG